MSRCGQGIDRCLSDRRLLIHCLHVSGLTNLKSHIKDSLLCISLVETVPGQFRGHSGGSTGLRDSDLFSSFQRIGRVGKKNRHLPKLSCSPGRRGVFWSLSKVSKINRKVGKTRIVFCCVPVIADFFGLCHWLVLCFPYTTYTDFQRHHAHSIGLCHRWPCIARSF